MRNFYLDIELDGRITMKHIRAYRRPTHEEAREHFRNLGYTVGEHIRWF